MFLTRIKKSNFVLSIRNSPQLRPVPIVLPNDDKSYSISDAFCWRACEDFETSFRYTDLIKYFTNKTLEDSKKDEDLFKYYNKSTYGSALADNDNQVKTGILQVSIDADNNKLETYDEIKDYLLLFQNWAQPGAQRAEPLFAVSFAL